MKKLIKLLVLLIILAVIGTAAYLFVKQRFLGPASPPITAASEYLVEAENYLRQNPQMFDEAIERFQAVILEAPGSREAAEAEQRIQTIQTEKDQAVNNAWETLKKQAEQLAGANDRQGAYDLLNNYNGPFASDLSGRRSTMKKELLTSMNAAKEKEAEKKQRAEEALTAYVEQSIDLLRESRFEEVNLLLEKAAADPLCSAAQDQFNTFIAETSEITALPEMICQNLRSPQNAVTEVYLKTGKESLRIKEVNGLQILADKIIIINGNEAGSTPLNFSFTDLSLREKARRLGNSQDPEYNIMRALMLIQGGKEKSAIKYLEKADTPLAQMISDAITTQQKKNTPNKIPTDFEPVFEPNSDNILIVL